MSRHSLPNYVRMHRKRMHITAKELAFLLGFANASPVSRYENFHRQPSIRTLLRLLVLFQCQAQELLAGEYEKAQEAVVHQARLLQRRYERMGKADRAEFAGKWLNIEDVISNNW